MNWDEVLHRAGQGKDMRRLLDHWDGGAFDPERKAVLTERGKFVLRHGQAENV